MSDKGNRITHKSTRKCQVFIPYLCQDCFFGSLSTFQPCISYWLLLKKEHSLTWKVLQNILPDGLQASAGWVL